ncbi:arsenite methyltransferase [Thermosediminibacter litoriperuensis]|uniref:Arsenite methyltransferase n=1 Tax=Thermosediminibacter litoriperuensis TaxID=291989 RepID=A0A5S5AQ36_9FIRM|nr:arsenite methyltransferase [Thermosediminibacter litoriperuensis]TYP53757.1 ubiquinone/menaquinone biosynthesis C-methylase UbiE [Thermosediminibacter litoriperuensis]
MGENIREKVKTYYGDIAKRVNGSSCCSGSSCCGDDICKDIPVYDPEYITGLPEEAVEASLGCANPIAIADLKKGEKVLDLGCGGGIDVFIAAKYVGPEGRVYGLDMTDEMLALANKNKEKMGINNVEFIKGYIEEIPMEDESVDVVISNCVINLSEDKGRVLKEAHRVLKAGGRLAVADIVMLKDVPENLKKSAEMWVGCIAGALSVGEYEELLKKAGFRNIEIRPVNIYKKDLIRDILEQKNLQELYGEIDLDLVDGAFAGALIRAEK